MKRISSLVWLLLGLSLAAMLVFTWYWYYQQGQLAESQGKVVGAGNAALRIQLIDSLLQRNSGIDKPTRAKYINLKAISFGQMGAVDSMNRYYGQAIALDPENTEYDNNIAYEWAKRGINLDTAKTFALKAVAKARELASANKPFGVDQKSWDIENNYTLGNYLDTYGWVLYRQGNYAEAAIQLKEAFKRQPDGNIEYHLGMALNMSQKQDEALEHLMRSLTADLEQPDSARLAAEQAYRQKNRSLQGFDDLLAKYQDERKQKLEAKELADGSDYIGKPAPDFSLPDLAGQKCTLSEQRGKVVVIDFWATWCQPCLMALPLVDKVRLQYKDQPVVFYAINLEGRDKAEMVKRFVADKGYSLPVLQGGRMGNGLDRVYGVTGIPTSFVVDQGGVIRFRHIGYGKDLDQLLAKELDSLLK